MCLPLPLAAELQDLRCEIDFLDATLDALLLRRIRLGQTARRARGGAPTDPVREAGILECALQRADSPASARHLKAFHRFLCDWSKEVSP